MSASSIPKVSISLGRKRGTLYVLKEECDVLKVPSIGLHSEHHLHHGPYCGGLFKVRKITDSTQALFCPDCGLRIVVPLSVTTIGELNDHLFV